jgi:hypothetical protein
MLVMLLVMVTAMVPVTVLVMLKASVIGFVRLGAQVIEVQAGMTFYCGLDGLQVCP